MLGARPRGSNVWTLAHGVQRCIDFSKEVVAETGGPLVVPVGSFDDFRLRVRVNDELRGVCEVQS